MTQMILYIGIIFIALGLISLSFMAFRALKLRNINPANKLIETQKLVIINFVGIGLSTIGLMLVVLSFAF